LCREGNWDLVGNNFPVFFVRDGMKFPDMVHALKPNPKNHIQEGWRIADFFSHHPEAMHMVLISPSPACTDITCFLCTCRWNDRWRAGRFRFFRAFSFVTNSGPASKWLVYKLTGALAALNMPASKNYTIWISACTCTHQLCCPSRCSLSPRFIPMFQGLHSASQNSRKAALHLIPWAPG